MPYSIFVCPWSWNSSERRSDEYKPNLFGPCHAVLLMKGAVDFRETFNRVSGAVFPVSSYLAGRTGGCMQLFVSNLVKGPGGEDKVGRAVRT